MSTAALRLLVVLVIGAIAPSALAQRMDCEALRAQIDTKLRSRGVQGHSLDIVAAADTGSGRVVGSCDQGSRRIVYSRTGAAPKSGGGESRATPTRNPQATPPPRKPAPKQQKKQAPVPPIGNY